MEDFTDFVYFRQIPYLRWLNTNRT